MKKSILSFLGSVLIVCLAALPAFAGGAPAASASSSATVQIAGELVINLDARDASAGSSNWVNKGSMGDFKRIGAPKLGTNGGQAAVQFDGKNDAYRSLKPASTNITGKNARTIEVWVFNPALDSTEECMVSWGHRGTSLANMAFNYGSDGGFSAATHYDADMSWGEDSPAAAQWHHLVYAYDGTTTKIYDNGVEKGSQAFALVTAAADYVNIATENSADGDPLFAAEWEPNWQLGFSGSISVVRVHSGALTPDQIKANLAVDKARFGVK